jgi:S-adenosylmethionine decarboxylase
MDYSTYGRHIITDIWEADFALLNDVDFLKHHMIQAAKRCGANILSVSYEIFQPSGVTIVVILSESHLSIHTYPEKGFAGIDCYTCGHKVNPQDAIDYLLSILKPKRSYKKELVRGLGKIEIKNSEG